MAHRDPESIGEGERTNALLGNTRCSCFCFPCFGSNGSSSVGLAWWERMRESQSQSEDRWWSRGFRALKKLREWSEIVAGPRWKTFIRRFNRNRTAGGRHGKFHYDPLSYALNFDEGHGAQIGESGDDTEDYGGFRSFSSRYASVPPPVKSTAAGSGAAKDVAVFG